MVRSDTRRNENVNKYVTVELKEDTNGHNETKKETLQ